MSDDPKSKAERDPQRIALRNRAKELATASGADWNQLSQEQRKPFRRQAKQEVGGSAAADEGDED